MNEIAIVDNWKDYFNKTIYNIVYGRKFKKLNIDKSLSDVLIARSKDSEEKEIFRLIKKSKNKEEFSDNIRNYLKTKEKGENAYASALLIGNVTGKYVFNSFYYKSLKGLNIDAFSFENQELLKELRTHFFEYIINDNKNKNSFAERIKIGKSQIRDLSRDVNKTELLQDFDKTLNGEETNDSKVIEEYLMNTLGVYSKEDIKNNFDFILYDINNSSINSLDDRRKRYFLHRNLSNSQLKKIDEIKILQQRLHSINGKEANQLLERLNTIENDFDSNIGELEDIYGDYEVLYKKDLINNLYVPKDDVTIIENYRDMHPQLIHQFIRSPEKFRKNEIEKAKSAIISERSNSITSKELTTEEKNRLNNMINQIDVNLDQYKVNYTIDAQEAIYSDSSGFNRYHSDTSNQISASVFAGQELIKSNKIGIIGIGFNRETLTPEAIAISSNSYKTTNKGLNNLEYNEENEFKEMSAPFSELIKSDGKSEVVMHRRGMDFDTKASYIFAKIDSSNKEQTGEIMQQIEQVRKKENLKVVIYDVSKIRESIEQEKQRQNKEREL